MKLLDLLDDLRAESIAVRQLVQSLPDADWERSTPALGWNVAHQIGHLAWTDAMSSIAVATMLDAGDTAAQHAWRAVVEGAMSAPDTFVNDGATEFAALPPAQLMARWDSERELLHDRLGRVDSAARIPWFGPPMKSTSMATARLMETWAHGLDIADALGVQTFPTDRIRHVCHLGFATRAFAYLGRGMDLPEHDVALDLIGPGGDSWTWGPADAEQRITGTAWDFARVAVRRVHASDTELLATGNDAQTWLGIVQAFAGPPGSDPQPSGAPE
ncbi:MAG: TIGR03084 family metal-binding protein [Actinomycetota bacterium]|nr:TIGR03084 family metal-binding protein [Actinomycetota bacterium]